MEPIEAMEVHIQWFKDIRGKLKNGERVNPEDIGRDDRCEVGKWLHGEGAKYKSLPEYTAFADLHARCHSCAEKAAARAGEGDAAGAVSSFGTECSQLSEDLFKVWLDFYYALKEADDGKG